MELLLGIDLGTSGTKTVLFDSDGRRLASHTVEYPLYQPKNGWAEQDPGGLVACGTGDGAYRSGKERRKV